MSNIKKRTHFASALKTLLNLIVQLKGGQIAAYFALFLFILFLLQHFRPDPCDFNIILICPKVYEIISLILNFTSQI